MQLWKCRVEELLTETQLLDDCTVTSNIVLLEVRKKISSVTNHLQEATATVVVLVISLHVLGQVVDAVGQKCDLNLGRTGITFVDGVLFDDGL